MDLKRGVFYQKCHDPDCRAANYKSPEHPIPPDYLPAFFDEFDDEELLAATERAEKEQRDGTTEGVGTSSSNGADVGLEGEEDGQLDITDEEMLAAMSGLEDSGIEN